MKKKKKIPHSLRKYLRKQKASIRLNFLDIKEKEEKIKEFYNELVNNYKKQKNETNLIKKDKDLKI